jgi:hypothetical protein
MHIVFWSESQKERDHYENGYWWEENSKTDLRKSSDGMYELNWTDLATDRDQWRALVNMVMSVSVP